MCATKHMWRSKGKSVGLVLSTFTWTLEMESSSPGLHRKSLYPLSYLTHALFTSVLFYMYLIVVAYNKHSINIC